CGEVLDEFGGGAVEEVRQALRPGENRKRIGKRAERVIGQVIAAEVRSELQAMAAPGPGEVVDQLILRDVTSLGEVEQELTQAGITQRPQVQSERKDTVRAICLRENGAIVAAGVDELVGRIGTEAMRPLSLTVI